MKVHSENQHVLPLQLYLTIGFFLLVLTGITVVISFFNFGTFNLIIAMAVATVKALLVALYFMHLKYDNKLFMTIFGISLVFVSVFIVLTMFDVLRRDAIDDLGAKPINDNAVIYQNAAGSAPQK